ncbi:MAG TPA: flagellar basal body rod C-terminal domain-containing protein [Geobacterales bacterium]|nr:flagellar basal body rod C-terminal domain-containing protein [Geobacterales bacterium]
MAINNVLDLAARQASWLLSRENQVAQNVANANTPGYKTADLTPFEASLQTASLQLTTTSPRHISIPQSEFQITPEENTPEKGDTFLSGNNVSLESEMMKGGEINRAYSLNAAVVKAFNSMIVQSAKG